MDVYVETDGKIMVGFNSGENISTLCHFSDIRVAIEEIEGLLHKLRQATPIDDWSHEDTRDLVAAVDHHMSLLPRGMEALVRMKWVKSTDAFHKYEECDYDDNLLAKSMRNIGTTYFKNDGSDSAPAPFIAVRFTVSPPMHQEAHSE